MENFVLEYGAMSSRYRITADNKFTAYVAALIHFNQSSHLIMLYEPKEVVENDQWFNPLGKISARLDEIFGGVGSFDKYIEEHEEEIKEAIKSIERLV